MEFCGKAALITGGSSGIGLETARLFSRRGAHVCLLARDRERLESALAQVETARRSPEQYCGTIVADVTDLHQCEAAVTEMIKRCKAPDILINSAGDVEVGFFQTTGAEVFRRIMEINYFGTVNMVSACLPSMLERRSGHIVNVSSVYGFIGGYGYSAYCASKFAVRGFSDSLRAELKPTGINVSIVFPQNTDTPQLQRESQLKPAVVKHLDSTKVMTPAKVAEAIMRGIARRQYLIIPGMEGKLLFWMTSLAGPATYSLLDRLVARAHKKAENEQER
ncbi:MAG: SDR family oxidoreductase [Chloroflexota bacterium]